MRSPLDCCYATLGTIIVRLRGDEPRDHSNRGPSVGNGQHEPRVSRIMIILAEVRYILIGVYPMHSEWGESCVGEGVISLSPAMLHQWGKRRGWRKSSRLMNAL